MTSGLPITGYAIAGTGAEHAPAARRIEMPPPGTKRSGGRLPRLAVALARAAHGPAAADPGTAVLFATSLGCLTETGLFVENMIAAEEATPKPRAFAASVHNAIASGVAMDCGAHGECQTFAHGETGFAHAVAAALRVRARAPAPPILLGALDEDSGYVRRGLLACGGTTQLGEGGAVLCAGTSQPLARIHAVTYARPVPTEPWVRAHLAADTVLVAVPGFGARLPFCGTAPFAAVHGSLTATTLALAVGVLAGEVAPAALGLPATPRLLTLLAQSRFGDAALILLER